MTETLVTIAMRFPTPDRAAVADQIGPVMTAAAAAGGTLTTVSIQSYEEDDET